MHQIQNTMIVKDKHKQFIINAMKELADYNAKRPVGHAYEFHTHAERVARHVQQLAKASGYNDHMSEVLYWATLPHDIGKTALPVTIWDLKDKPTTNQKAERRTHTTKGVEIVRAAFGDECNTDPFLRLMIDIMENHHETLDGQGFLGKKADDLSREVRIACICDAFDGWSVARPHFGDRDISPAGVIKRMETEKDGQFDKKLLKILKTIVTKDTRACQLEPSS